MRDLYETTTFEEFWGVYEAMHADPRTRAVHLMGTVSAGVLLGVGAAARRPGVMMMAPVVDYVIAQSSHRLLEGNLTMPYRRPWWHLRAELRLARGTLRLVGRRAGEWARGGGGAVR